MQLSENRSQIWFKVLSHFNTSIDGTNEKWGLPTSELKGLEFESKAPIGTWLTNNPKQFYESLHHVYLAEFDGNTIAEFPGLIWVKRARLVRRASLQELMKLGLVK